MRSGPKVGRTGMVSETPPFEVPKAGGSEEVDRTYYNARR